MRRPPLIGEERCGGSRARQRRASPNLHAIGGHAVLAEVGWSHVQRALTCWHLLRAPRGRKRREFVMNRQPPRSAERAETVTWPTQAPICWRRTNS